MARFQIALKINLILNPNIIFSQILHNNNISNHSKIHSNNNK